MGHLSSAINIVHMNWAIADRQYIARVQAQQAELNRLQDTLSDLITSDSEWETIIAKIKQHPTHQRPDLLRAEIERATKAAQCTHPNGAWSGYAGLIDGEYEDNTLFTCPDCGLEGG